MTEGIETTIEEILTPLLNLEGYELVAVETAGTQKNRILRLLIHKQGGLSVTDCKVVDQEVRPILEVHQILDTYKHLEIASPGLDRPLTTIRDFQRNIGKDVKILTSSSNGQATDLQGQVKKVIDGSVVLEQTSGKTIHINISQIDKGYIQLAW